MISCERSSCVRRLPPAGAGPPAPGSRPARWSSKKWANGPCPTSWRRPGHPQGLDDQPLGRDGLAGPAASDGAQARVERAGPQPGLVHDAEAVREPRVLGGREDPARALELADPAQPLEPRRVEQVLLGDVLVGQPGGGRLGADQPLGQLDVAVDRVADQVDGGEGMPPDRPVRAPRSATRGSTCPHYRARSVARTRIA